MARRFALLLAALFALFALPVPAQNDLAQKQSRLQVDGIASAVIDGLWEQTDRYWHDGDYNRIIDLCRICVEGDSTFDEAYGNATWLLWSQGESAAADWLLDYGVKRSPKQGAMYYEFGWHLFNTKRYADAVPYLKKAVAFGKVPVTAYTTLGHSYTRLNQLEDAVAIWRVVVKKFPNFRAGPVNLKKAEARLAAGKKAT